jgi:hypothetical protein
MTKESNDLRSFRAGDEKKMSHRQLQAELNYQSNTAHKNTEKSNLIFGLDFSELNSRRTKRNRAGLGNAEAIIYSIVLANTETPMTRLKDESSAPVFEFKENGQPRRYGRKDQVGNGKLSHYLR